MHILRKTMMKKERWNCEADNFLRNPPMKSRFKKCTMLPENVVATYQAKKHANEWGSSRNRLLRAVFASFLDLFCDTIPHDKREQVRTELCSTLINLRLVPSAFFSDELSSVRRTFAVLISNVLGSSLISGPNIDSPIFNNLGNGTAFSSRYRTDFEELEAIGEGGFGTVYKVKSRIDNCLYAVKKIRIKRNLTNIPLKVLSEVQVLASLQHENVVRYHCGWVEMEQPQNMYRQEWVRNGAAIPMKIMEIKGGSDKSSSEDSDDSKPTSTQSNMRFPSKKILSSSEKCEADNDIKTSLNSATFYPSYGVCTGSNKKPVTHGRFWNHSETTSDSENEVSIKNTRQEIIVEEIDQNMTGSVVLNAWKPVVYIQMELCSMTLEEYLIRRNRDLSLNHHGMFVDGSFNRELFIQLLSAIEYIHYNRLIHRDIKPSNVFLKHQGKRIRMLVGDFGLACVDSDTVVNFAPHRSREPSMIKRNTSIQVCHSVGVGTSTYSAPEQLQSTDYGPAVDIYSAGIVLFEAYNVFHTSMERLKAIEGLRTNRMVGEVFTEQWPSVARTILQMTEPLAEKRPTSSQLLQEYVHKESSTVTALREIVNSQEKELKSLRAQLKIARKLR